MSPTHGGASLSKIDQAEKDALEKEHKAQAAQMSKMLQADRRKRKEEKMQADKEAREQAKAQAAAEAKRKAEDERKQAEEEQRLAGIAAAERVRARAAADRLAASGGNIARNDVAGDTEQEAFDVGMRQASDTHGA